MCETLQLLTVTPLTHSLHCPSQHHTCHLSILFFPPIHHRSPLPSLHLNLRHHSPVFLFTLRCSPLPSVSVFPDPSVKDTCGKRFQLNLLKDLLWVVMLVRKCGVFFFLKAGCQEMFYNLKSGSCCCLSAVLNDALQRLFVCFHKNVWIRPATSHHLLQNDTIVKAFCCSRFPTTYS